MGRFTYYWRNDDGTVNTAESDENYGRQRHWMPQPLARAEKVWVKGPSGGVQLVRCGWRMYNDPAEYSTVGYISNVTDAMSEFGWAVLAATPVNIRI